MRSLHQAAAEQAGTITWLESPEGDEWREGHVMHVRHNDGAFAEVKEETDRVDACTAWVYHPDVPGAYVAGKYVRAQKLPSMRAPA